MKNSVKMGMNKTGLGLAPKEAPKMLDDRDEPFKAFVQAEADIYTLLTYQEVKQKYIRESGSIGSLPPPPTATGMMVNGIQKITFRHPEVLLDKIGERLAFERTGARLYEAFILKCETVLPESSLGFLRQIHADELAHFHMLQEELEKLGADPTCITPCANVSAVASQGLIQVVNDPRTSIAQSAQAILSAELIDTDGWSTLLTLVEKAGLSDFAKKCRDARDSEEMHLTKIRTWLAQMLDANDVVEFKEDQLHSH